MFDLISMLRVSSVVVKAEATFHYVRGFCYFFSKLKNKISVDIVVATYSVFFCPFRQGLCSPSG